MTVQKWNDNILELFSTNVGSHMWRMNHEYSDIDVAVCYIQDSRSYLTGVRPKGKQIQNDEYDYTYYELSHVINHLLKGNVNYLWAVMSPIPITHYRNALMELRQIVSTNLAKNAYNSINGLAKHNIYHYIEKEKSGDLEAKKLNVIGRTLKFGINLLTWGKCMFEKVDIENVEELYFLKEQLDKAYMYSTLPDEPDINPYYDYLIKWRLKKFKLDGVIE